MGEKPAAGCIVCGANDDGFDRKFPLLSCNDFTPRAAAVQSVEVQALISLYCCYIL